MTTWYCKIVLEQLQMSSFFAFHFRIPNKLKIFKVNYITRRAYTNMHLQALSDTFNVYYKWKLMQSSHLSDFRAWHNAVYITLQNFRPRFIKWNGSQRDESAKNGNKMDPLTIYNDRVPCWKYAQCTMYRVSRILKF